jgi:hypothetical protein
MLLTLVLLEGISLFIAVCSMTFPWDYLSTNHLLQSRVNEVAIENGLVFHERLTGKLAIETLILGNLVFSQDFRKPHRNRAVRRVVNLVASTLVLVGRAPLFAIIALAFKLDSNFHCQDEPSP